MNRSPRRMRKSTVDTGAAQGHIRSAGHASARTLDAIAILLAGLALTLLLKRYAGIQHDAVLYLGEGLLRRSPAIFSEDLAFVPARPVDQVRISDILDAVEGTPARIEELTGESVSSRALLGLREAMLSSEANLDLGALARQG